MHQKFELLLLLLLLTLQLVLYHFGRELERWQIPLLVTACWQRRELAFPQGSCQTSCLLALLAAWGRLGGLVKLIRKEKKMRKYLLLTSSNLSTSISSSQSLGGGGGGEDGGGPIMSITFGRCRRGGEGGGGGGGGGIGFGAAVLGGTPSSPHLAAVEV